MASDATLAAPAGWRLTTLGEEVDLLTGFPFKSGSYTSDADGLRLLRGDNVVQGRLRWHGVKRWPPQEIDATSPYLLKAHDVVLAMDRPWIEAGLKYARIDERDLPCLLVQRVARLRACPQLDPRFLHYLIGSSRFTDYILSVQTGTAVPHISAAQIKAFPFHAPSLEEQRAIADILGVLDDKININSRINETLEALILSLYGSWFGKREGVEPWNSVRLGDLASLSRDSLNPARRPDELFDHYSIGAFDKDRTPSRDPGENIKSNKLVVPDRAVLISKINPRIPRTWYVAPRSERLSVASTEFFVVVPSAPSTTEYLYALLASGSFRARFAALASGTSGSHQRVRPQDFLAMEALVPPADQIAKFTKATMPLYERILRNITQSETLESIRSSLLPRLLDGTVQAPADEASEAVLG
jgi:type I restriction enzyme S subunit